jgi:acetoin utilization deacetylase AcuC-like enzyme
MQVTAEGFGALAEIIKDIAGRTCGGKALLTLEGGYNPQGLRDGVRAVLLAMQRSEPLPAQVHSTPAAEQVISRIVKIQKKYWKSLRNGSGV